MVMNTITQILAGIKEHDPRAIGRALSLVENNDSQGREILASLNKSHFAEATVIGITGPPGAGKSTLTNQLISHYRLQKQRLGIIAIDPTSPLTGGAVLGDRVRMMNHALDNNVVIRSMATRGRLGGLCAAAGGAVRLMAAAGCKRIIIETVGVGQSEIDIIRLADLTLLTLAPGLGDDIQAMKAGLLEVVDLLVVNKADCPGAETLLMDMESMIRQRRAGRQTEICRTIATRGEGIAELAATLDKIDQKYRQSGEQQQRRQQSYEAEIVAWAGEIIRPELLKMVKKLDLSKQGDPRQQAEKLLQMVKR
jgi:LAO/AO transport system kinase